MRTLEKLASAIRNLLLLTIVAALGLAVLLNGHYVGQKLTADSYRAVGQNVPEPEDPTQEQLVLITLSWKLGVAAGFCHLIAVGLKKRQEGDKVVIVPTKEWWGRGA